MLTFYIFKNDSIPPLDATLINVGGNYNPLANLSSVALIIPDNKKPGNLLQKPATVLDYATSKVRYTWTPQDINSLMRGTYNAYFVCTYLDNSKRTFPNDGEFIQLIVT